MLEACIDPLQENRFMAANDNILAGHNNDCGHGWVQDKKIEVLTIKCSLQGLDDA